MGGGDLGGVFADLDLGEDVPLVILDGGQLIHAAEDGLGAGGDEPLAHPEGIDAGSLADQIPDNVLVQGVGGNDLALCQACLLYTSGIRRPHDGKSRGLLLRRPVE